MLTTVVYIELATCPTGPESKSSWRRQINRVKPMDQPDHFKDVPARIVPYIPLTKLDDPVQLFNGPFRLIGPVEAQLQADLRFRWSPSAAVEFEGTVDQSLLGLEDKEWTLASDGADGGMAFSVPVQLTELTHAVLGLKTSRLRGVTARPFTTGEGPFETLRFCLANFPNYNGETITYEHRGERGLTRGRLETTIETGCCQLDKIPEASDLVRAAERDAGFVISHVGLWIPSTGVMSVQEAESILKMLHSWFGLLRGARTGPLFPQGINADHAVVWQQLAPWRLRETQGVSTWLPEIKPLDLSGAFRGFANRWNDPAWHDPIETSISWFVEANALRTANESRIVLAQVALELLSWVLLVESQRLHHQNDFEGLSAAGRIRALLHHIGVSATVPGRLNRLQALCDADAFDGPGVITKVRNALVHSREQKRKLMESVDGEQRMECSQLALQYLELAILAICGHNGYYARRRWKGWKGDDEDLVPWSHSGSP
jgi:hypothetical protein